MGIKSYNPKDTTIVVGTQTIQDYDNGAFIEVAYEEDAFEHLSSADGEEMRVAKNDNRATVTLTLMQGSDSCEYLSNMRNADRLTDAGVLPFIMKDIKNNDLIVSESCWHKKAPTYTRGNTKQATVFTLSLKNPTQTLFAGATIV